MNVFLNTPGVIEFELKPKDKIIANESHILHCDDGIVFGVVDIKKSYKFSPLRKVQKISAFTNLKDSNQFICFSYNNDKGLNDIEVIDLKRIHSDLVIFFSNFFAGTIGVEFENFDTDNNYFSLTNNLLSLSKKSERKIVKGNGTIFLCKPKMMEIQKKKLGRNESFIIAPSKVFAFTKSCLKNPNVKNVKGIGFHFEGPGEIYLIEDSY